MTPATKSSQQLNQRVRAILLTGRDTVLFIKRVKPNKSEPYWVAPGGGVEANDRDLFDTLRRELREELGAQFEIGPQAFVLHHEKAGKQLEEHFFICHLIDYDLSLRHGPEFDDPARGEFIPEEVHLDETALSSINIKTPELRDWLIDNSDELRRIAC